MTKFFNFTLINVNCKYCSNFLFLFATHDLSLTNINAVNVNNPSEFSNKGEA